MRNFTNKESKPKVNNTSPSLRLKKEINTTNDNPSNPSSSSSNSRQKAGTWTAKAFFQSKEIVQQKTTDPISKEKTNKLQGNSIASSNTILSSPKNRVKIEVPSTKQPNYVNNNSSKTKVDLAPKVTKIIEPTKTVNISTNPEADTRTKPLHKPKPDPRKSTRNLVPLNVTERQSIQTQEIKPISIKTKEKSTDKQLQISSKWKINYNELEFGDVVSSGSAGEVFLGYYFGTPVAIKKLFQLASDQKHLVEREYAMLTEVNHPNIVQFLGLCDHETGIYLITEYVEHGDLFDLLVFSDIKIDWKTKIKIALQTAQAVFYLHSRDIIHRDLKSQNILIGEKYKVKLCDLGLATVLENNKRTTVCGTNEWMAPEIMTKESYDSKIDVFSFGIVLQELITNSPPPKREISKMLKFDVDRFIETVPEECPEVLAKLVIDCTKFNSEERPSFKEIVSHLRKLSDVLENNK